MKVTITENNPTKTFNDKFNYAICYGDRSGILAICTDYDKADEIKFCLNKTYVKENDLNPLVVVKVVNIEE